MFGIIHPLDDIIVGTITFSAVIVAVSYVYSLLRRGKLDLDAETITSYKQNSEALENRIKMLEEQRAEDSQTIKELNATLNKLIGRNEILEETLALRDPKLTELLAQGFTAIIQMNKAFNLHNEVACDTNDKVNKMLANK